MTNTTEENGAALKRYEDFCAANDIDPMEPGSAVKYRADTNEKIDTPHPQG